MESFMIENAVWVCRPIVQNPVYILCSDPKKLDISNKINISVFVH